MGPGSHLKELLQELALYPDGDCACERMVERMDKLGIEGCKLPQNEADILGQLRKEAQNRGWIEYGTAAVLAVKAGLLTKIDPRDPAVGLLAEAMRRCEKEQEGSK